MGSSVRVNLAKFDVGALLVQDSLLSVQHQSWLAFTQDCHADGRAFLPEERDCDFGLQAFFTTLFPIIGEWLPYRRDKEIRGDFRFVSYRLGASRYSTWQEYVGRSALSYSRPLWVTVQFTVTERAIKSGAETVRTCTEANVFVADLPEMTDPGTFVIRGIERVVLHQLLRAPGAYCTKDDPADADATAVIRLIPVRGAWVELSQTGGVVWVSVGADRKRRCALDDLLSSWGNADFDFADEASERVARYFQSSCGDESTYSLGRAGRERLNQFLGIDDEKSLLLTREDLRCAAALLTADAGKLLKQQTDQDHLGNRVLKSVGAQLSDYVFMPAMSSLKHSFAGALSSVDLLTGALPGWADVLMFDAVQSEIDNFFIAKGDALSTSQYLDQLNPLAELTHKRRVTVLGRGGLSRENAGFGVRDVHHSAYGRLCPIETPEGANIGLVSSLACHAQVDSLGKILAPYRDVRDGSERWLDANEEEAMTIAPALADSGAAQETLCRFGDSYAEVPTAAVQYTDVSPFQMLSVSAGLIPFVGHDDANRALMGANMQRQAVPLVHPEPPLVGTGLEQHCMTDNFRVCATAAGTVVSVSANEVRVRNAAGREDVYELPYKVCTNQGTDGSFAPVVAPGQAVAAGDVLATHKNFADGELSLGINALVAFMPFDGWNFEDAIVISDRLVKSQALHSVHLDEYRIDVKRVAGGVEETTAEVNNVPERVLRKLDPETGIVRVGETVLPGDLLVGKVTPTESAEEMGAQSAEDKLVHAIFGTKSLASIDSSFVVPAGSNGGTVVEVRVLESRSRDDIAELRKKRQELKVRRKSIDEEYERSRAEILQKCHDLDERENYIPTLLKKQFRNMQSAGVSQDLAQEFAAATTYSEFEDCFQKLEARTDAEAVEDFLSVHRHTLSLLDPTLNEAQSAALRSQLSALTDEVTSMRHTIDSELSGIEKFLTRESRGNGDLHMDGLRAELSLSIKQILESSDSPVYRLEDGEVAYRPGDGAVSDAVVNELIDVIDMGMLPVEGGAATGIKRAWEEYNRKVATAQDRFLYEEELLRNGDILPQGVVRTIVVKLASLRPICIGDKLAGRHGNKGVVSKILPEEDMPYLEDGTPVDIVLNPLGVPSRMNVGQLYETLFGLFAKELNVRFAVPPFSKVSDTTVAEYLTQLKATSALRSINDSGQVTLYDGYTGRQFDQPVTVGFMYMLKLNHLVDDKMHARSTGPYTHTLKQPVAGRSRNGGQRFGEMETWALEAYGAAYTLQEIMTVKSDEQAGRIMKHRLNNDDNGLVATTPESLIALQSELRGLGLNFELLTET